VNDRVVRLLGLLLLTGGLLVGCTTEQGGVATPTENGDGAASTTTSAPPSSALPPRPADITLNGVDPCATLTPQQMDQLGLVNANPGSSDVVDTGDVPKCNYSSNGSPRFGYGVSPVTDKGAEYWLEGSGNVDTEVIDVSGYGAVQVTLTGTSTDCAIAVDVADGQQLFVTFTPGGDGPTPQEMCAKAKTATEMALETLKTLR
jgi:hypothetical protein